MTALRVSRFSPSMMSPEDLEAILVQRHDLARRIVADIRAGVLGESKHHWLLIGVRGIGKSHMVALTYHRIAAMADLEHKLRIAWLHEEEWGVSSLLDLFIRIFRALDEEYPRDKLLERAAPFYQEPAEVAEQLAGGLLREYVGDRTLLVLTENLDDLFNGLGGEGQKRLRAYIQENPFWSICATAQSLFNGVKLQISPFYGFFQIEHLEELTLDGAVELLKNIAERDGDAELAEFLATPTGRARVRAVQHLAGGNHRVYVIFSDFLTRDALDQLVDPLMRTIDDLTPYYQSRMSWLPQQQRKIVELLCDRRGAVQVKELAQRCFLTHQVASSQLKSLRDKGYVQSTAIGRESYYELREPLMRMCLDVKKHRAAPIRLLVDFLRIWYSRDELTKRLEELNGYPYIETEYLLEALRSGGADTENPVERACQVDCVKSLQDRDWDRAVQSAEDWIAVSPDGQPYYYMGLALAAKGDPTEADRAFRSAIVCQTGTSEEQVHPSECQSLRLGALEDFGEWDTCLKEMRDISCAQESLSVGDVGLLAYFVNRPFKHRRERDVWASRASSLVQACPAPNGPMLLEASVILSIYHVDDQSIKDRSARQWLDAWRQAVCHIPIFERGLRWLEIAIRYRETNDEQVLLELPLEERKVVIDLLEAQTENQNS